MAQILVFKIRPSQNILKIRDGTPLEAEGILTYRKSDVVQKKRLARILLFKIRPSQGILIIRDGTPLEAEGILTYRKKPQNCSVWHFSSKLYVPSNVVSKKRVARILVFKIRPSQNILKIRDGTPLEAEGILTYRKRPSKLLVARILLFKIRPSQGILKFRDDTPLKDVVQKKRVARILLFKIRMARILLFKIRPSQEILKIRDGTPFEAEGILTYRKKPSKLIIQKKRVARILLFKIRPSQGILKIRDGTPLEAGGILTYRKKAPKLLVARILVFKIRPSQKILKIRDGTPLEAEGILTYRKSPRNCSIWHFSSKLDVPSNVVQKKRVKRILVFKIRPSKEILKIRDGTPLEAEGILTYRKKPSKLIRILTYRKSPRNCSIWPSKEILKIRDGTPLEAEGILTYRKSPRNCSVWHFSSKLDVPSNVVQKKRVAHILVFKIRPSQHILKIRDGTPLEAEGILTYRKRPSQGILKNRGGTPLEAGGILTYRKSPRNCSVWHFSSKLYVPSNVIQEKRVARILVFKIRPSQKILKIRDGIHLEAEGILTYRKSPRNCSVLHFSSKLDVPSNVVQKKRVHRFWFSKLGHLKKF
ncbi:hypothetical protein OROMI_024425 [Orobanche minor]